MVSHSSIGFKKLSLNQNHETCDVKWNLGEGFAKVMCIGDVSFANRPELIVARIFLRNYLVYIFIPI